MKPYLIPLAAFLCTGALWAIDKNDTWMLHEPAVSAKHLAFTYDNDLFIADRDGTNPRRLTTNPGRETNAVFSPDGKWLAFNANYDGNPEVYIISVDGGVPKRMTFHPGQDGAQFFSKDGKHVYFASTREIYARGAIIRLFRVPVTGGMPERIDLPTAFKSSMSQNGKLLAYTLMPDPHLQWKNYRGGLTPRIWVGDYKKKDFVEIPKPEGGANDTDPMFDGNNTVYFTSDRDGEFNLYSYDVRKKSVERLTKFDDFPVLNASYGAGWIVFEKGGRLFAYDVKSKKSQRIKVGVSSDLEDRRPRWESGPQHIRSMSISPTGKRAVLGYRGDVITVPAKKGDPRNLTESPGVHEREPVWSPDGKTVAYFSDKSGEYELHLERSDGRGEARAVALKGSGFYRGAVYAPDSNKIAYLDNSLTIWITDLESGESTKVAAEVEYGPAGLVDPSFSWSPDSTWLAYDLRPEGLIRSVFVYDLESGESHRISDGLSEVSNPVFDRNGKYLYFTGSTDAGPVMDWFAQSNNDMVISNSVYLAVLKADEPSPLAPESDEEAIPEDEDKDEDKKDADKKKEAKKDKASDDASEAKDEDAKKEEEKPKRTVMIDLEDIQFRIINLPVPRNHVFRSLTQGGEGELLMVQTRENTLFGAFGAPGALMKFSIKKRKADKILDGVSAFVVSADGKQIGYQSGPNFGIIPNGGPAKPGQGKVNMNDVRVWVDPAQEWPQMLREAWRVNRDYFYATNFHGVDWEAEYKKYEPMIHHAATREDMLLVIQWLCSELAVGHHRTGGGSGAYSPDSVPVGLLGADYETDQGRYRFKKVYGGLNFNPGLRSPLSAPGVSVKAGEYLIAVDGVPLRAPENLYSRFIHKVTKNVRLEIADNPDGKDSREVVVKPVGNEMMLRNMDWIEGNIKRVHEATDGRVGYVFVPDTAGGGHSFFKRWFFPQTHKQALIVDERWNNGGQIADYVIDHLRRPYLSSWATRHGRDFTSPKSFVEGPKVMLINEPAGSGGDMLPWMFRQLEMGTLIGKRTWGGLVGILGFPSLMDGAQTTAPDVAIWTEDGFIVENVGVAPDIDVELDPKAWAEGKDAQLEKAIEVILKQLEENPPPQRKRPAFPVRNQ